jgi:chaperonin cofactor prefoldin
MTTCFCCLSSHLQANNNEFKTKHPEVYKVYNTIKTIETYLNKLMGCLSSHLQANNNEFKTKHPEVYKVYNTIKTIETYLNKLMGSN